MPPTPEDAAIQQQATAAAMTGHSGDIDGSTASAPAGGLFWNMIVNWLAGEEEGGKENHEDGLPGPGDTGE